MTKVLLEPELEEMAADWPAAKRFDVGRKLERWSHQLLLSARIMSSFSSIGAGRPELPRLPRRKAALN